MTPVSHKFYYGWIIVGLGLVSMSFWFGVRASFSVFYVALLEEFLWSRDESAGVQSVAIVTYTFIAPIAGLLGHEARLRDRRGLRARQNVRRIVELAEGADRLFIEAAFLDAEAEHAARAAPDGPLGASSFPPRAGWIGAAGPGLSSSTVLGRPNPLIILIPADVRFRPC